MTRIQIHSGITGLRSATLILAAVASVLLSAPAVAAADCSIQIKSASKTWDVDNPPAADTQQILDVISSYARALDDQNGDLLKLLFTVGGHYEACVGGDNGQRFYATPDKFILKDPVFVGFAGEGLQTRHIVSAVLLQAVRDGSGSILSVKIKATMLVAVKDADSTTPPKIDYTADLRGELTYDDKSEQPKWRFDTLTNFADTTDIKASIR